MDSTSKEYLYTLQTLRQELLSFKAQQNELKFNVFSMFEVNKRLTEELRECSHMRFLQLSESDVGQLEQKLQAAVASKTAAVEMWQAALQQLEKQEELLVGKKSIVTTERNELEKQFLQLKDEYTKGMNILSNELSSTRNELSKLKKEFDEKDSELEKHKKDYDLVSEELNINKKINSELSYSNHELENKIVSLQSVLQESNKTLDTLTKEITTSKAKNNELLASVSDLKIQNKKLKSQILIHEKDAKDSLHTAEEAIWQKKEVIYKEEQYKKDIELLKSSKDIEIQKLGMQYKSEMKDIQKKAAENAQNFIKEIQQLHKEIGEKQNMFERANREKQALESKIELLFSENSSGMPISHSTFDDMSKRLTMAERTRDEYELKFSSLEISLHELKSAKEEEIQSLLEKQKNLQERNKVLSNDFNQASFDRVKLSNETTRFKKKCYELEKEFKSFKLKHMNDVRSLEEELRNKLQIIQEQQHLSEEHYKDICKELQQLLDTQFKISKKWKIEAEDLISKSESKISELCQNIIQLKGHNSELIAILHQSNVHIPKDVRYLINIDSNLITN